jgi:hypothetical protein
MLKIACVLAAIAGFGLVGGAVAALTVDAKGGTAAGTFAAISAGVLFAVAWVALVVNFYRGRTMPDEEEGEEEEKASPSKDKPSSKQKPSSSKP